MFFHYIEQFTEWIVILCTFSKVLNVMHTTLSDLLRFQ